MNENELMVTEGQQDEFLNNEIDGEFKDLEVVDLEPMAGENKLVEALKFVGKTALAVGLYEAGKKAVEKIDEKVIQPAKAKKAEKKAAKEAKKAEKNEEIPDEIVETEAEEIVEEVEEAPVEEKKTEKVQKKKTK